MNPDLQKGLFLYGGKLDTVQGEAVGSGHKGKGWFLSGAECKMLCEEGISVCAFL